MSSHGPAGTITVCRYGRVHRPQKAGVARLARRGDGTLGRVLGYTTLARLSGPACNGHVPVATGGGMHTTPRVSADTVPLVAASRLVPAAEALAGDALNGHSAPNTLPAESSAADGEKRASSNGNAEVFRRR